MGSIRLTDNISKRHYRYSFKNAVKIYSLEVLHEKDEAIVKLKQL